MIIQLVVIIAAYDKTLYYYLKQNPLISLVLRYKIPQFIFYLNASYSRNITFDIFTPKISKVIFCDLPMSHDCCLATVTNHGD